MLDIIKLQKLQTNLSRLGFEPKTIHSMYAEDSLISGFNIKHDSELVYYLYLCEIQKWLRDVHNIDILIEFGLSKPNNYGAFVKDSWCHKEGLEIRSFITYEEALLTGIEEAILIIKNE